MGALSPVFSQITKIEISNLVLKKVKKHLFDHISASENVLLAKIGQNDRDVEAFEHTKFHGDPWRHKIARAENVSNLPKAIESRPLEQLG